MSVAHKPFLVGLAVPLVLGSALARAQDVWPVPVADPVLATLIAEALANNPEVAAAQQAATAAGQRPAQARSLPNPMVSVEYTNDGWSPTLGSQEMTTLAFMASQELPYAGKRGLRGDIAAREAGQIERQAERVRRNLTAAVKRAYYGLLLSRHLLELIHDQEENWKQIEGTARARYAVGQGAQQDVLRVQVEVTRIEQPRAEQEAEAEIRLAELNRLVARPEKTPLETPARLELRALPQSPDQLLEWAAASSPEVQGLGLGIERASLAVDLARKDFKPDFSVVAAYMNRGGLPPMWQAGIGISAPLYRKRLSAGLAEAEAELRSRRATIDSARQQLRYRTRERLAQLRATERIATLYGEGIVPQGRMSVEAALANYQTGKVPFITVLEALTTLYADRATHLRLLASHEQTLASLEEASLDSTSGMVPSAAGMAVAGAGQWMAGPGGSAPGIGDAMGRP